MNQSRGVSTEPRAIQSRRSERPEIPWREIAGLRDLLAHEYYQIEIGVIDDIVARDLTPLAAAVAELRRGSKLGGRPGSAG